MSKILHFLLKHPGKIIFFWLIITIAGSWKLKDMQLQGRISEMLPSDSQAAKNYEEFLEKFQSDRILVVLIEGEKNLKDARGFFIEKLEKSPLINKVMYKTTSADADRYSLLKILGGISEQSMPQIKERLTLNGMKNYLSELKNEIINSPLSGLYIKKLKYDSLGIKEIFFKNLAISSMPIDPEDGSFVSSDNKATVVFAEPKGSPQNRPFVLSFMTSLNKLRDDVKQRYPGINISFGGSYAYFYAYNQALSFDLNILTIIAFAGVLGLFYVFFRSFKIMIFIGLNLFLGTILTLSAAVSILGKINQLSIAASTILLGIGIDCGIHLYNNWMMGRKNLLNDTNADANQIILMESTIKGSFKSIFLATVTTIWVLLCLTLSGFSGLKELGIITAFGMLIIFSISFTLLPSMLILYPPKKKYNSEFSFSFLSRFVGKYNKLILLVSFVLFVVVLVKLPSLKLEGDLYKLSVSDLEPDIVQSKVGEMFGLKEGGYLILIKDDDLENVLEKNDKLYDALIELRNKKILTRIDSVSPLFPSLKTQSLNINKLKRDGLVQDFETSLQYAGFNKLEFTKQIDELKQLQNAVVGDIKSDTVKIPYFASRYIKLNKNIFITATYAHANNIKNERDATRFLQKLENTIPSISVTGYPVLKEEFYHLLTKDLWLISIVAIAGVIILLLIYVRKISTILLLVIPLVFSTSVFLGFLELLKIPISLFTLPVLPMIFGIGVDAHIYIWEFWRKNPHFEDNYNLTGRSVLVASFTTILAFGILGIARISVLRILGLSVALGIGISLLSAILFMPSLIMLFCKKS